jgi:hypothetical protein
MPTKNGIAIFSINAEGEIARSPERILVQKDFCRLENIDILDGTCVITDLINHSFSLYSLTQDPKFRNPVQTVNLGNAAPHGAKFSPDGGLLVISCLGLKIVNQEPQFLDWESPREDKIFVFERIRANSGCGGPSIRPPGLPLTRRPLKHEILVGSPAFRMGMMSAGH